jgi:glycosyltransferase involved in cell wall biosynthesis
MPTIAIQFARLGPYHLARIDSAVEALAEMAWTVVALETAGIDATYAWNKETAQKSWARHTVFPDAEWESIPQREVGSEFRKVLSELQPDAVAISGWSSPDARTCLSWCRKNGVRSIVMSETREADDRRNWGKELVKKRLVNEFDAGLVGAHSHRDYLMKLGLPSEAIQFGYNVVDNHYFTSGADRFRRDDASLKLRPYFLASNRFVERKNLDRLVSAYAEATSDADSTVNGWDLCLLGDGPLMPNLQEQCKRLGLKMEATAPWDPKHENRTEPTVFFPGFRQIRELPRFYAHAGCFVHPALIEPWGLVINEAMACSLPVLSSSDVGAAEELVIDGFNGWKFEPKATDSIAKLLLKVATLSPIEIALLGQNGFSHLIKKCPTKAFGDGLKNLLPTSQNT